MAENDVNNRLEYLNFVQFVDTVSSFVSASICIPGILMNTILVYLILTCTPISMKSYSIYLLNFALFDLATCIIGFFSCQKVVFSKLSLIYIFHGPCKNISAWFCYFCHCFECHTLAHSQWILLASFIYRYRILLGYQPNVKQMVLVSLGLYSMSLTFLICYLYDIGDSNELMDIMDSLHPEYSYKDKSIWGDITLSGNVSMLSLISFFSILYMTFPCVPIYVAIMWFRHHTMLMLNSPSINISPALKTSHRKLIRALTAQGLIPVYWLLASLIYTLAQLGLVTGPVAENTPFRLMDCIPTTSPIVSLVFINAYSDGLFKLFNKGCLQYLTPSHIGHSTVDPSSSGNSRTHIVADTIRRTRKPYSQILTIT